MSLSVIMEEPGIHDDDLEYVGRVPHRRRPQTYGGKKNRESPRYGSPSGRYNRAPAGRSLGGLRISSQSYSPNAPGPSRSNPPKVTPIRFVRNPRHPKSLYDTEISMRYIMRGRQPKLTPELSFPDPKNLGAARNPIAPRFHHDFDVTEEDYNIQRNPLAGVDMNALLTGDSLAPDINPGYDDTGDDDTDSDISDGDSHDESVSIRDDEGGTRMDDSATEDKSTKRRAKVVSRHAPAIYSTVQKYRAPKPPPPPQPPPRDAPVQPVIVLPRAVASYEADTSYYSREPPDEEVPPPLPTPLNTLAEEDESQNGEAIETDVKLQGLRDMSTQTTVTVQAIGAPEEQQEEEPEDRFIQIPEGREDSGTMTHTNWEVVAPWSQHQYTQTHSGSLAVNYRRVVAELSGTETPEPQRRVERQHTPPPQEPVRRIREDPPPWSPPIVPQVEQILRPMRGDMMEYPPPSQEWDSQMRSRDGMTMSSFCNRCCLITLLLLALLVLISAVVLTVLYVTSVNDCTSNCGLIRQPGYLAGFVLIGAVAILVVFAACTWCCFNLTRSRRPVYKYTPRERSIM